jgi:hypothetical protein
VGHVLSVAIEGQHSVLAVVLAGPEIDHVKSSSWRVEFVVQELLISAGVAGLYLQA